MKNTLSACAVVVAPALCLLPFLDKAFHIDDTVYLWVAEQIIEKPFDFYGFQKNWSFHDEPMYAINKNPPGVSYYIVAAALIAGWNEIGLHSAFLLPIIALGAGTYCLARDITKRPAIASLAALLSPVVLVSSSNIMSDTLTLAFYVWAIVLWLRGLAGKRHGLLFMAAVCMSASTMTKYLGVTVIPLLIAYSLAKERRPGTWMLHFLVPLAVLALYQAASYRLYGMSLLESAVSFAINHDINPAAARTPLAEKTLIGLSFAGGCHVASLVFLPMLWRRRTGALLVAVPAGIVGLSFAANSQFGNHLMNPAYAATPWIKLQFTVFVVAGVHIFALAIRDWAQHRTPESLLLALWAAGIFAFSTYVNWTVNARTMLPMAPAVGILIARRLEIIGGQRKWPVATAIAATAALGLAAAWADYRLANAGADAAARFAARQNDADTTTWVQGNWGMRWYFEEAGAIPFDSIQPIIKTGDVVIQSSNNLFFPLPADLTVRILEDQIPVAPWLTTMDRQLGAGFYSNAWGPLPYAFGRTNPERYLYLKLEPH